METETTYFKMECRACRQHYFLVYECDEDEHDDNKSICCPFCKSEAIETLVEE